MEARRGMLFGLFLVAAIFAPWWFILLFGTVLCARWFAYEVIVIGAVLDFAYGLSVPFWGFYTISFLVVAVVASSVRSRLL